ncbi:exopolysaccharide biosynthesis protein [Defluviimonas salinarum]|uniref:Exopolysaccharide biosynthesis protein n=1 Tax=Defluviimonas salinarum TaxID=2992147 RepID=A0ABT3J879_9RHOB|nr:exopolysaccharide biosynthesis protein [Defluviimonas salinarum]MCW3783904.1 exopolysaccharide biosynthesis protein [Defluviimonas salinarum]
MRYSADDQRRLSGMLEAIAAEPDRARVSIGDLVLSLGTQAHGALLLIFAAVNLIPMPPGSSALLAVPLVILTFRLAFGHGPWLPAPILRWSVSHATYARLLARALPHLRRAERMVRPRGAHLFSGAPFRVFRLLLAALAITVLVPLPFSAMLPSFAICLIAIGILERDIAWATAGVAAGLLSLAVVGGVIFGLLRAAALLFGHPF